MHPSVLLPILLKSPSEQKAESTCGRAAGIQPSSLLVFCSSYPSVTIHLHATPFQVS